SGFPTDFPSGLPTDFPTALPSNIPMIDAARWVSDDGGRTWSSVATKPGAPVTEIPDGAQIVTADMSNEILGPGGTTTSTAMAMTPDGVTHPIATAPSHAIGVANFGSPNNYSGKVGGCYFLYVEDPSFSLTGLVISRDNGRTWQNAGISGDSRP